MKVRVAVLGAGFMGRIHAAAYGKGGLDAEVLYVVDSDPKRAERLASSLSPMAKGLSDVGPALKDPSVDAVDVCLPTDFHRELCERSFAAGKNVLCEKPMTHSLADADRMIASARASGKVFMIAHVIRFWPEYVAAVKILQEGHIGALKRVSCSRLTTSPSWSAGNWMLDARRSGGAVRDLAIHDFDFINQLAGMPTAVRAFGSLMDFTAAFRFPGGAIGSVEASYIMPQGFPFRMSFLMVGENGSVEFDGTGGSINVVTGGKLERVPVTGTRAFKQNEGSDELDGYYREIAHFVDCVQRGRQPEQGKPADARDALEIALKVEAALR